ncbi:MarR family winged helix-turn-helix transcriptional regulator [Ramlibacter alkalitolerans]|uniref:MarR family transcriptional regulator n=1 Tax=Ramlibacter alkalitolerans TaxID=2039631 RepID=A0ABS1JIM0_9BURK|nr:MarR family transcriptional regulator [Ramlibacter alkalitolerans]MBL0424059.1 MarR family transcriptional regulator [Ramlibacter alkalitolerans]
MELEKFFPYRLAVLAEQVSLATAQVYGERFSLTRDEWRVLSALADQGEVRTSDVKERTTLEKMQVSRALARLEANGLVARSPDPEDGRAWRVRLLPAGTALYRKIGPMVQAREEYLLSDLTAEEQAVLASALEKVEARARQLTRQG